LPIATFITEHIAQWFEDLGDKPLSIAHWQGRDAGCANFYGHTSQMTPSGFFMQCEAALEEAPSNSLANRSDYPSTTWASGPCNLPAFIMSAL
jgi:hypothetical protein